MKKRILVDVDGVLADCVGGTCAALRAAGFERRTEEVTDYDLRKVFSAEEMSVVNDVWRRPGFCAGFEWYPGARDFVEKIVSSGADVVALTKPYSPSPTWAYDQEQWLGGLIPRVVHTGHKELVPGDVLIEDSPENLERWLLAFRGPLSSRVVAHGFLVDRPYNRGREVGTRVRSFDELLERLEIGRS